MLRQLSLLGTVFLGVISAAGATGRTATQAELTLLRESLEKTARDIPRWACTQTMVQRDGKGRVKSEAVVRYDPSKPYPEQWTPVLINGKPPGDRDFRKYRRWGERQQKRDENPKGDSRLSLGEVMNLDRASVAAEADGKITFEIPLLKDRRNRFPPEKFQVFVRLNGATAAVESVSAQLREPFRAKLVVKIKSGEGFLNFAAVDPNRPPTLVDLRGDASASIFFVSIGGEYELKRTDFKYVKPYYERFEVQIGPMKAIDF